MQHKTSCWSGGTSCNVQRHLHQRVCQLLACMLGKQLSERASEMGEALLMVGWQGQPWWEEGSMVKRHRYYGNTAWERQKRKEVIKWERLKQGGKWGYQRYASSATVHAATDWHALITSNEWTCQSLCQGMILLGCLVRCWAFLSSHRLEIKLGCWDKIFKSFCGSALYPKEEGQHVAKYFKCLNRLKLVSEAFHRPPVPK